MELNEEQKKYISRVLLKLRTSKFRSGFHLRKYMIQYIDDKGMDTIEAHAFDFIHKNLVSCHLSNDGKQTPMKGHPVFIAQHACGCCCRGCLEKWHSIPKTRDLTDREVRYIVALLMEWIERDYTMQKGND